ncbi:hypothetical protein Ahy_A04g018026 [Arachis hypogaea]|uniref:Uncharacterized protein n=1 Tax=Arachis hypogaea TaxID=3818 RepID=A0A445DCM0_ARAHY|nr:hypothetical protein Ahy_A04g018026 [Arachis hypogaea]
MPPSSASPINGVNVQEAISWASSAKWKRTSTHPGGHELELTRAAFPFRAWQEQNDPFHLRHTRIIAKLVVDANGRKYCQYDSDIATGLGVGSFFILVASQVIIMIVTRCLCCGKGSGSSPVKKKKNWMVCKSKVRYHTVFCQVLKKLERFHFLRKSYETKVTFIIAAACLLAGSVRNAYHTKYRNLLKQSAPSCETMRKSVFRAGAAFIVLTGIASEIYYVSFSKSNNGPPPYARDTGVRMENL